MNVATQNHAHKSRRKVASPRPFARIALARACEASAPGEAPTAFRILAAGTNKTDKGDLVFTPKSAEMVMRAFEERGNPLALYYEHEDRLPLEKRGGAPMKGACSAPSANLVVRNSPEGPELWAENVAWTEEAKRQIKTGERRQISPVAAYDEGSREVLEILNVSLCSEGATHFGTLLASRSGKDSKMDELMNALQEALESSDFEAAENIVQQMEAEAEGDEAAARMTKMAKACVKAAKPKPPAPPPPPASGEAATKRLAATRDAIASQGASVAAFDRAVAEMQAATREAQSAAKESRRATVQTLIAANRDLFDVADEREHLSAADPQATQRHIASLTRKVKAGVVAFAKPGAEGEPAKAGEKKPVVAAKDEPTAAERAFVEQFNRSERDPKKHITVEEVMASRKAHGGGKPSAVGVA